MYNAVKVPVEKPQNDKDKRKMMLKEKHYKNKTRRMANLSYMRREDWMLETTHSKDFNTSYFNGAIPLIHPKHHKFRDIDEASTGFSPFKPNITDAEFSKSCKNNKNVMTNGKPGEKKYFLRLRDHLKEIHKRRMVFNAPKKDGLCETVPIDTKMIYYPKWREHSPNKWKGNTDFLHSTKAKVRAKTREFGYKKKKFTSFMDPYEDSLSAIGQRKISRETVLRK